MHILKIIMTIITMNRIPRQSTKVVVKVEYTNECINKTPIGIAKLFQCGSGSDLDFYDKTCAFGLDCNTNAVKQSTTVFWVILYSRSDHTTASHQFNARPKCIYAFVYSKLSDSALLFNNAGMLPLD